SARLAPGCADPPVPAPPGSARPPRREVAGLGSPECEPARRLGEAAPPSPQRGCPFARPPSRSSVITYQESRWLAFDTSLTRIDQGIDRSRPGGATRRVAAGDESDVKSCYLVSCYLVMGIAASEATGGVMSSTQAVIGAAVPRPKRQATAIALML